MCGIAGFIQASGADPQFLDRAGRRMAGALRHRGPDGEGCWVDAGAGLVLAHARLAVVDLSDAGRQPMVSADGRWVLSYNGEIYNARELHEELAASGAVFRGHSDTEVLLEALAAWGVERTLPRLIGMFAFAAWDRRERELYLARDRLGIKPLYWGQAKGVFFFASELKAIRELEDWEPRMNRDALAAYFRFHSIPSPHSIYQDVFKLPPGQLLRKGPQGGCEPRRYWDLYDTLKRGDWRREGMPDEEARQRLDELLRDAVDRRRVADVPLGAFLSGGIDSSLVVALMQALSDRPVRTFSIGFDDPHLNEAPFARAVAGHLKTHHTELIVGSADAQAVIPRLAELYDEPLADSSQIPTHLVSRLAREQVTVALSGDGGDELFAGYRRHAGAETLWNRLKRFPRPLRRLAAKSLSVRGIDRLASLVPDSRRSRLLRRHAGKIAAILEAAGPDAAFCRSLVSHEGRPESLVPGAREPCGAWWGASLEREVPELLERMQYLDATTYLPDDLLAKVDRASMAVGLEVRVPLLDHRVAEFAFSLPRRQKWRNGQGKWLLRQVLERYVPEKLLDRPKAGFAIPLGRWLRGELRPWAESLLEEGDLESGAGLNAGAIRRMWLDHLAGVEAWTDSIWAVLMLQSWRRRWGG